MNMSSDRIIETEAAKVVVSENDLRVKNRLYRMHQLIPDEFTFVDPHARQCSGSCVDQ